MGLCDADPAVRSKHDAPAPCQNVSCVAGGGAAWNVDGAQQLRNNFDGACLHGTLGPGAGGVNTAPCDAKDPQQAWSHNRSDATVRAYGLCLTAPLVATDSEAIDIFAVELEDGACAVLFWNQRSTDVAAGTSLALTELPARCTRGTKGVAALDVWSGAPVGGVVKDAIRVSAIPATGSVFVRIAPVE